MEINHHIVSEWEKRAIKFEKYQSPIFEQFEMAPQVVCLFVYEQNEVKGSTLSIYRIFDYNVSTIKSNKDTIKHKWVNVDMTWIM